MAVKTYLALYNKAIVRKVDPIRNLTKAQAEEANLGKEPVTFGENAVEYQAIEVTAETEAAAAQAVRRLIGAPESEGEFSLVETPGTAVKKKSGR